MFSYLNNFRATVLEDVDNEEEQQEDELKFIDENVKIQKL